MSALLDVRDLAVSFSTREGTVRAVRGASLRVDDAALVGLVGESGSGKSVTALALLGLLGRSARVTGTALFAGRDLLRMTARERRRVRGAGIGLVLQNALGALDPAMSVGAQVAEVVRAHRRVGRPAARRTSVELLERVGLPDPERGAAEHPHRLSGGMCQRATIAAALAAEPRLLIADEPTTALDVTVQAAILDLLASLATERRMAVLLITHDLALLARFAQRIVVMYGGRVMEEGDVETIFGQPAHPYTWGLMRSLTRLDEPPGARLAPIPGAPASASRPPAGCPFHPRCPHVRAICTARTPALEPRPAAGHACACHRADELAPPIVAARGA